MTEQAAAPAADVHCVREDDIAFVNLTNPARLNAMTRAMWLRLRAVFDQLNADASLRCVVVRGAGGAFRNQCGRRS